MVYKSEPYKSPETIAKNAIGLTLSMETDSGRNDAILVAIRCVFEYAQYVNERLNNTLEVNHLWDGS